ncbi:hypothetical protein ACQJBY_031863 [Aegilops geniculata]
MPPPPKDEDDSGGEEEEGEEHEKALCGACNDNYGQDEFWICCDACETWFHDLLVVLATNCNSLYVLEPCQCACSGLSVS